MRLAGTCKRYSNKAMLQLINAAIHQALLSRSLMSPYQAKVMNTLEPTSKRVVCRGTGRDCNQVIMG
jgi:hypothetical protein